MRYILALLPPKPLRPAYIQAAQQVFSPINDGYLLSEGISLPHVTLCSFHCEEDRKLTEICANIQQWDINHCPIRFLGLMLKKGKVPVNHYSVGLSVVRDSSILHLHHLAWHLLQTLEIQVLNPSQDLYHPHLTLAGICWQSSDIIKLPPIIDDLISIPVDSFHLALGRGDDIGQYLETVFEVEKRS